MILINIASVTVLRLEVMGQRYINGSPSLFVLTEKYPLIPNILVSVKITPTDVIQ